MSSTVRRENVGVGFIKVTERKRKLSSGWTSWLRPNHAALHIWTCEMFLKAAELNEDQDFSSQCRNCCVGSVESGEAKDEVQHSFPEFRLLIYVIDLLHVINRGKQTVTSPVGANCR